MIDLILEKRDKIKKASQYKTIRDMLLNVTTSIYKWENLPHTVRAEYVEAYLNLYGQCAILKDRDGDYIAGLVERGGSPDKYGLGTTPIVSTLNGKVTTYSGTDGDVILDGNEPVGVIVYNNSTKTPNAIIGIFAEALTESIISLYQNVIHSRYNPVFVVSNDVIKRAVENKMSDIISGKPAVIMSDNILDEIETGRKALDTVQITDVDKQYMIQFIAKTIDDLMRWFLTFFGQAVQGNSKLAQQTVDEVNGTLSASFILPENGWRWRNSAANTFNTIFNTNIQVSYNKPWAVEVEKYTEDIEPGEVEENEELENS